MEIIPIPYFNDNYAYAVQYDNNHCYLFDAGDGVAISRHLKDLQLTPTTLFITHNHHDHIDGIQELEKNYPALNTITPARAQQRDFVTIPELPIEAIYSPGHTLDHTCYFLPTVKALITGDTIFAGGTGRCFTGNFELYCDSLHNLSILPGDTKLYGAHEYLADNKKFIQSIGGNTDFYEKRLKIEKFPSPGITLSMELEYNSLLQLCHRNDIAGFKKLRKLKDNF